MKKKEQKLLVAKVSDAVRAVLQRNKIVDAAEMESMMQQIAAKLTSKPDITHSAPEAVAV